MAIRNSGKHGRRKVSVPNITGAARSSAQSAITSAQLTYTESSTDTSNSGLSQIVQSQGVSSGSVVLIGSNIPFTYYNYVAPPPPIIATPPPIIATPPPIIAVPPPIIAVPPPIIAVVTCGPCQSYTVQFPTCNGEDSYVGNYTGTRQSCSDGSYVICTQPTFTSFGACISRQSSGCGGTNQNLSCSPPPIIATPPPIIATPPPIIATPPPIIATPPPIIATPPPIIATPPPIIATPPPIIATGPDCSTASCGNDPGRACCFYLRGVCRAC